MCLGIPQMKKQGTFFCTTPGGISPYEMFLYKIYFFLSYFPSKNYQHAQNQENPSWFPLHLMLFVLHDNRNVGNVLILIKKRGREAEECWKMFTEESLQTYFKVKSLHSISRKLLFHQRFSSIKGCLPLVVVFH